MKHSEIKLEADTDKEVEKVISGVRVPHLSAAAFCVTAATRGAVDRASDDRRLERMKLELFDGSISKACQVFEKRPTPMLLIVEVSTKGKALLEELGRLAEVCDPETRVVVIGVENDIKLYRKLMDRGIAEYLTSWVSPLSIVATVQELFTENTSAKLGKMYAFVGAKGGVGTSTIAQNIAWTIAEDNSSPSLLLDLEFRFSSAMVNLDLKPISGLDKYLSDPEKIDAGLLDRLIVKRGEYLGVLPGFDDPLSQEDPTREAIERLTETARASFPYVVADIPHEWTAASRDALTAADEVVIVASPDLANLRNAQALFQKLVGLRPNDHEPRLLINAYKSPKRPEIDPKQFAKSVGVKQWNSLSYDPATFSKAAAQGRTLRELAPRSKCQATLRSLSGALTGKNPPPGWLGKLLGRK